MKPLKLVCWALPFCVSGCFFGLLVKYNGDVLGNLSPNSTNRSVLYTAPVRREE